MLEGLNVRYEMGSESGDYLKDQMCSTQELNKIFVRRLHCLGYNGELLSIKLNEGSITPKISLTV